MVVLASLVNSSGGHVYLNLSKQTNSERILTGCNKGNMKYQYTVYTIQYAHVNFHIKKNHLMRWNIFPWLFQSVFMWDWSEQWYQERIDHGCPIDQQNKCYLKDINTKSCLAITYFSAPHIYIHNCPITFNNCIQPIEQSSRKCQLSHFLPKVWGCKNSTIDKEQKFSLITSL